MSEQESQRGAFPEHSPETEALYRHYWDIASHSLVPPSFHGAFMKELKEEYYYHTFGGDMYIEWVGIAESLFRDGLGNAFLAQYGLFHADIISLVKIQKEMGSNLAMAGKELAETARYVTAIVVDLENEAGGSGVTGWRKLHRMLANKMGFGVTPDQLKGVRERVEDIFEDHKILASITLKSMSRYAESPKGYLFIPPEGGQG